MSFIYTQNYLLLFFVFQIFLNIFFIRLWNVSSDNSYQAKQKIHNGSICRLGGLAMILSIYSVSFFNLAPYSSMFIYIIYCSLPLILIGIIEDLYQSIQPKLRLFSIFVSSSFLIFLTDSPFPIIELPFFYEFVSNYQIIYFLLLVLSLASLANGFNLIDGANGLLSFTSITILICLSLLANQIGNNEFINLWHFLIIVYIIQLLFNFPLGFIFFGDLGAYITGLIIGFFIIIFFGIENIILTWQIVLILIYPIFEVLFSIIRRKVSRVNITLADRLHLHQLIFDFLQTKIINKKICNNFTTVILLPIWFFPLFWMLIHDTYLLDLFEITLGLFIFLFTYIIFYIFFLKIKYH